nr:MAG TPA_asm: hypothetical protein [Caudoviricetes sp.]
MYLKIKRRNRPDCIVMIGNDCATKKCVLVELSPGQIFMGKFDSIEDAIANIMSRADVVCFSLINNPFAPPKTANAINHEVLAYDPSVCRAKIEKWMKNVEELDNHLSDLIVKDLRETK